MTACKAKAIKAFFFAFFRFVFTFNIFFIDCIAHVAIKILQPKTLNIGVVQP